MTKPSKTVIITGANSGLGYECAKRIAQTSPEYQIVIAGRSSERIEQATRLLVKETGVDRFTPVQLNLASLDSVRKFAEQWPLLGLPPLSGLICNAGVQYSNYIEKSEDGYEATFAVNYLGHFLLTNLLVEHMTQNARIIVLSSITHDDQAKTPLPKALLKSADALANPIPPAGESVSDFVGRAYSTSKLCILMFAYEMERRLRASGRGDITVNTFDPGGMLTGMMREWKPSARFMMKILWPLLRLAPNASTPRNSAKILAEMAISEKYQGISGKFFSMIGSYRQGARERQTSAISYDRQKALELWEGSNRLIKERK